ncbi:MAG: glycosyltransferase family 2 protein [Thermodesulfobacteriota bacterium]|nr:glycosyltransferase family 2 protein [Thermodesulfobacteriota bacterium]
MPKVTIIIPTHNRARLLISAIKSINDQQCPDIEIIIVDDGSTDDTLSVIQSMQLQFPYISYCPNDRQTGPAGARNAGILKARGEYLAFLDSDDVWLDGHLIKGVSFLDDHPHVGVLFGNFRVVDMNDGKHPYDFFDQHKSLLSLISSEVQPNFRVVEGNLFTALLQAGFFHFGSAIIRTSATNDILLDEALLFGEDRDYAIRLYKDGTATFAYREDPVFVLRRHDLNLTRNDLDLKQRHIETGLFLSRKYETNWPLTMTEQSIVDDVITRRLLQLSYLHRKKNEYGAASVAILKSFRRSISFKQIKALLVSLTGFLGIRSRTA